MTDAEFDALGKKLEDRFFIVKRDSWWAFTAKVAGAVFVLVGITVASAFAAFKSALTTSEAGQAAKHIIAMEAELQKKVATGPVLKEDFDARNAVTDEALHLLYNQIAFQNLPTSKINGRPDAQQFLEELGKVAMAQDHKFYRPATQPGASH